MRQSIRTIAWCQVTTRLFSALVKRRPKFCLDWVTKCAYFSDNIVAETFVLCAYCRYFHGARDVWAIFWGLRPEQWNFLKISPSLRLLTPIFYSVGHYDEVDAPILKQIFAKSMRGQTLPPWIFADYWAFRVPRNWMFGWNFSPGYYVSSRAAEFFSHKESMGEI